MASKKPTTTTQPVKINRTLKPQKSSQIYWCNISNIVETYKKITESRIFEGEPESISVHNWFKTQLLSEMSGIVIDERPTSIQEIPE